MPPETEGTTVKRPNFKIVDAGSVELVPWEVARKRGPRKYDFLLASIDALQPGQCITIEVPEELVKGHERRLRKNARPQWGGISPARQAAMHQFSQMLQSSLRKVIRDSRPYRISIRQTLTGDVAIFKVAKDDGESRKVSGDGMRASLGIAG